MGSAESRRYIEWGWAAQGVGPFRTAASDSGGGNSNNANAEQIPERERLLQINILAHCINTGNYKPVHIHDR